MSEAVAALDYWRTQHNQSATVPPRDEQPHRYLLAEYIASLFNGKSTPESVAILELGCSSGRNLSILRTYLPNVELWGIEPNPTTFALAKSVHGTDDENGAIYEGDHTLLEQFVDDAFDVAFTCSVLDHIPHPEWQRTYDELVRVARHHVVLLEPMERTGDYGWIEANCADIGINAAPYSWLHNYLGHDAHLQIVRDLPIDAPQWAHFGSLYRLAVRHI